MASSRPAAFLGHPIQLVTLSFTEMWERFSYYGMRALLVLYMVSPPEQGGLGFNPGHAGAIYGLYTSLVYLAATPGGWIADTYLGLRLAILIGAVVIAAGHFVMLLPGLAAFYLGMGLIIAGTGFLKPTVSSMVGLFYGEGESARRDAGYSIFYMGINLGALLAPLVCGFLGQTIGWHVGFGAAGVGMVLGIGQYLLGWKRLGAVPAAVHPTAAPPRGNRKPAERGRLKRGLLLLAVVGLLQYLGVVDLRSVDGLARGVMWIILLAAVAFFGSVLGSAEYSAAEKRRVGSLAFLFAFSGIFWAGSEQAGSSLNIFAEKSVDLTIVGLALPASMLQSTLPLLLLVLAPLFTWLWPALARAGREPSTPVKFAIGLICMGLSFVVLVPATRLAAGGTLVSPAFLLAAYFLSAVGELCLSPVGLSTFSAVAPERVIGQAMGVWFLSMALGNLTAGRILGLAGRVSAPTFALGMALVVLSAGGMALLLRRPVQRLMQA
ncbi:MAG TPA: peptide MFS transporter [Methylomirabilota bacterium]|nr:peptide MFS transporter [Methylomirabilota bacterium]